MKLKSDPRHLKRIKLMQELFSWNFNPKTKPSPIIGPVIKHLKKIDKLIQSSAPDRAIEQINKIDLSILRLATFELIIEDKEPPKAIIDEAIELGKEFGSDSSSSLINGALGHVVKLKKIKI